jgi:hypothetical protein
MSSPDEISLLVRALARYWRAYPFASDTCEGIARWWLFLPPRWNWRLLIALDWMVAEGMAERLQAADGHIRYRRLRGAGDADKVRRRLAQVAGSEKEKGDA